MKTQLTPEKVKADLIAAGVEYFFANAFDEEDTVF